MALPVIKKKVGESISDYCSRAFGEAVRENGKSIIYDGFTNAAGKDLLIKYKTYIEDSLSMCVSIVAVLKTIKDVSNIWNVDERFSEYKNKYIIARSERNVIRLVGSLARQRHVFRGATSTIRKNEINATWKKIFEFQLEKANERIHTVEKLVEENLICTPYALYIEYLKANNISYADDIKAVLNDDYYAIAYAQYTPFDDVDARVTHHVLDIMHKAASDEQILKAAVNAADAYEKAIIKRKEQRYKEKDDLKKKQSEARIAEAKELLYGIESSALKMFASSYKTGSALSNVYTKSGRKPFYIIAVIDTELGRKKYYTPEVMFVRSNDPNNFLRSSYIKLSYRFETEEEAKEMLDWIVSNRPSYACNICRIDLGRTIANYQQSFNFRTA